MVTIQYANFAYYIKRKIYANLPRQTLLTLRTMSTTERDHIDRYINEICPENITPLSLLESFALFERFDWMNITNLSLASRMLFVIEYIAAAKHINISPVHLITARKAFARGLYIFGGHYRNELIERFLSKSHYQKGILTAFSHGPFEEIYYLYVSMKEYIAYEDNPVHTRKQATDFLIAFFENQSELENALFLTREIDADDMAYVTFLDSNPILKSIYERIIDNKKADTTDVRLAAKLYCAVMGPIETSLITSALNSYQPSEDLAAYCTKNKKLDQNTIIAFLMAMANPKIRYSNLELGLESSSVRYSTAISAAIEHQSETALKILLYYFVPHLDDSNSFDFFSARNDSGCRTHIGLAFETRNQRLINMLIQAGALGIDRNASNNDNLFHKALGFTPKTVADEKATSTYVKMLIDAGLDVNMKDKNGFVPLDFAAIFQPSSVKILLHRGAVLQKPSDYYSGTSLMLRHLLMTGTRHVSVPCKNAYREIANHEKLLSYFESDSFWSKPNFTDLSLWLLVFYTLPSTNASFKKLIKNSPLNEPKSSGKIMLTDWGNLIAKTIDHFETKLKEKHDEDLEAIIKIFEKLQGKVDQYQEHLFRSKREQLKH